MMRVAEAAKVLEAASSGDDIAFSGVSIDSRTARRGDLFVAIRGERFDGHKFIGDAAHAGAAAAMVTAGGAKLEDQGLSETFPLIRVKDTRRALGRLAAHWRAQFTMPLVALTGSSGKTTVKEMLAAILREAAAKELPQDGSAPPVLATRGNLNNDLGVPLMLLELAAAHRYAVIEMGMNHAGEIRYLTGLAAPDVALVVNAGHAHIEHLGSREAIARAKGEIFAGLKPEGAAVINADDKFAPMWRELAAGKRIIEFGLAPEAAVSASYTLHHLESEMELKTPRGDAPVALKAPGLHNVRNALAAAAAAVALDVAPATIAAGLARFEGIKGRLQAKRAISGATLIDDTYNANPESVRAAVSVLGQSPGRKLLVLGDMGELGGEGARLHTEIGEAARVAGVDRLLTLGKLSEHAAKAFGGGAQHFTQVEDLLAEIETALGPQVTVLVKGSRFMQMERVVKAFAEQGEPTGPSPQAGKP